MQKGNSMPSLSMFYGIIIYMFFFDDKKHHRPHIHANFGEYDAVIAIDDGEIIKGKLPKNKISPGLDRNSSGRVDGGLEAGG